MEDKTKIKILSLVSCLSLVVGTAGLIFGLLKNKQGESAYEIAVKNGFVGTEAEWLNSLKGSDGQNGNNGIDGKDAVTPFDNFYSDFDLLNTKLKTIDTSTNKTVYDRFSQLDVDIEETFTKYKLFDKCFYYSYKDNQFIYVDLTNYLLNDKTVIYNQTTHYRKDMNVPVKSMDLYTFIFNKGSISDVYSNYLTKEYTPMGYINDHESTQLTGYHVGIRTNLDVGTHENKFIIKYIRNDASSGQEALIRSVNGTLIVDALYDTVYYYGNAQVFTNVNYPLNFTKLYINDVEYVLPE